MSTLGTVAAAHVAEDVRLERRIQSVQELLADDLRWVESTLQSAVSDGPAPGADAVFEDKQAVHVTTVRAAVPTPRRSRSEKISGGTRGAGSPDMRRSESENGRRRRRSTSSAVPEEWGCAEDDDDEGEEFRRAVEAFIAKQQTRFHREESFGLVVAGDDAQAITVAAAAVSPVK
jgi:hypothetical protein